MYFSLFLLVDIISVHFANQYYYYEDITSLNLCCNYYYLTVVLIVTCSGFIGNLILPSLFISVFP